MVHPALLLLLHFSAAAATLATDASAERLRRQERDTSSLLQIGAHFQQPDRPEKQWLAESRPGTVGWGWDPVDSEPNTNVIMPVRATKAEREKVHVPHRHKKLVTSLCILGYIIFPTAIVRIYWSRGVLIIVYVLSYLASLATMTISVKHIYTEFDFKFPKILTAFHLCLSAMLGFFVLLFRAVRSGQRVAVPSLWEFLSRIFPISFCFGVAVGLNNMGLVYLSPVIAEILGALNPLVCVPLIFLLGMPFHALLLLPISVVVCGVVVAVQPWGGLSEEAGPGIVCVFLGIVLRSVKSVLQQEIMTGVLRAKFDEYVLLAWSCATSSAIMFVWSFVEERGRPYSALAQHAHRSSLSLELVVSMLIAVLLNISHLWVTKALGAVSSQLMGQTKTPLILLGSVGFLGDRLDRWEYTGFAMVLVGSFIYGMMHEKLVPATEQSLGGKGLGHKIS